ncbi:hypothetical protein AAG570_005586 [Ranatra chinensis]|uniref:Uncharacterized protein n=1 Tax=Ranatra chinensis TaxID=642074 RepID=A0ABD0XXV1_9HEMI
MASERRNMFHKNKKQETTEISTCNLPPFCDCMSCRPSDVSLFNRFSCLCQTGVKVSIGFGNMGVIITWVRHLRHPDESLGQRNFHKTVTEVYSYHIIGYHQYDVRPLERGPIGGQGDQGQQEEGLGPREDVHPGDLSVLRSLRWSKRRVTSCSPRAN